jgi:hypothetical protein
MCFVSQKYKLEKRTEEEIDLSEFIYLIYKLLDDA